MIPQIQFPVHSGNGIAMAPVSRRDMFAAGSSAMGDSTRSIGLPSSSNDTTTTIMDTTTAGMDHSHPQHHDEPASKRQKPPQSRHSFQGLEGAELEQEEEHAPLHYLDRSNSAAPEPQPKAASPQQQKKKRVSFAPAVHLGDIHSTQWSLDELLRRGVWYTQDELLALKHERTSFVRALKRVRYDVAHLMQLQERYLESHPHKRTSSGVHTPRGLEAYFSVARNREYKAQRRAALAAVLQQQGEFWRDHHRQVGGRDAVWDETALDAARTRLREVSRAATRWARETATRLGREDAAEAAAVLAQEEAEVVAPGGVVDNNDNDDDDDWSEVTMHSSGSSPAMHRMQVLVRELQEAPLPPLAQP